MVVLRRSSFAGILLLVASQCMVTSGFQLIHNTGITTTSIAKKTKTLNRLNIISSTTTAATTTTSHLMAATPQEEKAVVDFKMITEEESQLRKIGGGILGIITIVSFFALHAEDGGYNYANLSTGAFAALSTYRTGAEYQ